MDSEGQTLAYQVVSARRAQYDVLLWQAPVLSLTAQAFLFTIELAADTSRTGRIISAILSVVVSVLSIQLMSRYRALEIADAKLLEQYEQKKSQKVIHGKRVVRLEDEWRILRFLSGIRSFRLWSCGLALFGATSLAIIILTVAFPAALR